MSNSKRIPRGRYAVAVTAALAAMLGGGWTAHAAPDLPTGDGLGIPGLEKGPEGCSVTSTDPKNQNSCNSDGGNGSDGKAGAVHRDGRTYYGGRDGADGADNTSR
ncbi:MAG: hypothetical protein ACT4O0_06020 [Pseudonocardia sp.]